MPLEPTKHVNGRMWQPGQSGNLNGRPVGSRTAFSAAFCKDLAEVWSEEGREAMVTTAKTNPTVFFATCARLIPNDVRVTVEQHLPGNLSPEDWAIMREIVEAVRQAIPDASSKPPGAVLNHVLEALRVAEAKQTDCPEKMSEVVRDLVGIRKRRHMSAEAAARSSEDFARCAGVGKGAVLKMFAAGNRGCVWGATFTKSREVEQGWAVPQ